MIDFRVVSAGFPSLDMIRSSRKRLMNAITQNQEKQICFFIIGHSTYLKVTEGNARYATFPNTVKFQLQEEVLARSATTAETLLASEKSRISQFEIFIIRHSTKLNVQWQTFPNTNKFQLQEAVLARSATTVKFVLKTLPASEKSRISHFEIFHHQTFHRTECPMANVPEHEQISAARSGFSKERYTR